MTQHPGLMTPRDLFGKLERELALLEAAVSADTYFNFVITAYHLCDWIGNDHSVPVTARAALKSLRQELPIRICRDLANGSKHFRLDYPNVVVADATCTTAFGTGRYREGAYGEGEPSIMVTLADGTVHDGLTIARSAVQLWEGFFADHGL